MTKKIRLIALLISIVTVISMFAMCVSANPEATGGESETSATTENVTESTTEGQTEGQTESETQTESGSEAQTEANTSATTTDDHEHSSSERAEIITNIVVIGIIVIVAAILIIKFRHKLAAFLRSVKSELKKVVWASGSDTRKSFLVVIVITIVIAAAIGILDFAFSKGISGLVELLGKIKN